MSLEYGENKNREMDPQLAIALGKAIADNLPRTTAVPNGGWMKVRDMTGVSADDWMDFRNGFEISCAINGWDDQRARRECGRHVVGKAGVRVRRIPLGDAVGPNGEPVGPIKDLLDAYEERFIPKVSREHWKMEVKCAVQREDESIMAWCNRYREAYTRAYPEVNDPDSWAEAVGGFVNGLRHKQVAHDTRDKEPATITMALKHALSAEANRYVSIHVARSRGEAPPEPGEGTSKKMQQMQQGGFKFKGNCNHCRKPGHMKRDCEEFKRSGGSGSNGSGSNSGNGSSPYARGGSSGRGGRGGGGRGAGRGGNSNAHRIQELQRELQSLQAEPPTASTAATGANTEPQANSGWNTAYPKQGN